MTTVRAQPALASRQVLLSNSPLCQESPALAAGLPAIAALGSSFSSAGSNTSVQVFTAYQFTSDLSMLDNLHHLECYLALRAGTQAGLNGLGRVSLHSARPECA